MTGAQAFWRTASAGGIRFCFANPGTTELSLVSALPAQPDVRAVLCLFEGVAFGAADGYGRMSGVPAMTLSHLGPGFGNGIANCHNARRARTPLVNVVGNHPTWHQAFDPPLHSDIEALARPMSSWVKSASSAEALPASLAEAIAAATTGPGQVATLVVPADCQWGSASATATVPRGPAATFEQARIDGITLGPKTALLVGAHGLRERGMRALQRIRAATGCPLFCESFPARLDGGGSLPALRRFPYLPEMATALLRGIDKLVLVGASEPVAYFGYENGQSRVVPDGVEVVSLASPTSDVAGALEALAARYPQRNPEPALAAPVPAGGALSPLVLVATLAQALPAGSIVVDEGVSIGGAFLGVATLAREFSYLSLTGGATGMGLSLAIGAALAQPDRRVFVIEGDGSALYTPQALWTQAHEGLRITNLVYANDSYRMLQLELKRTPGAPAPATLTDFSSPSIDWIALSRSFGVPAARVTSRDDLERELQRSIATEGPTLIEVRA